MKLATAALGICSECDEPWRVEMLDDCIACGLGVGTAGICPKCMIGHRCNDRCAAAALDEALLVAADVNRCHRCGNGQSLLDRDGACINRSRCDRSISGHRSRVLESTV